MGRIAAIGGGTFEETDELNKVIIKMSGKEVPNIAFIGTAAEDSTNPLTSMKKSFKRVCPGVTVRKISVIRNVYKEGEIDEILNWADIVYVGPGNTAFMLEKWREFGIVGVKVKVVLYELILHNLHWNSPSSAASNDGCQLALFSAPLPLSARFPH